MSDIAVRVALFGCFAQMAWCQQYPFLPIPGAPKSIKTIFQDSRGRLWLGGRDLACFDGSRFFFLRDYGFPSVASYDITEDARGTIWLGSPDGLYRFASPFRLEYWTAREGLPDAPWSVTRIGKTVYAGVNQRVLVLDSDRLRWRTVRSFPSGGAVSSLPENDDGTLLAGFQNDGVVELGTDGRVLARTDDHSRASSMRLERTPSGKTWVDGNSLGLLRREGSRLNIEQHRLLTQPAGNGLGVKYEQLTHKLWTCYNGGLVVKDERGNWREYTTRDGLLINGCWDLAPLSNGDVWYAYFNASAIARIRPDAHGRVTIRQYGQADGIPEPQDDVLTADRSGRLWRSGDLGIYVANPAEADRGEWLKLDESDGFPADDINSGSYFTDSDGSLWWGADNDLAHYLPPADLATPEFAPQVFVSAFSWNGSTPRLAEAVDKLPHRSAVTAHIGSLQFDRRNGLRLRYRVLPEQSAWRESGALDLALGRLSSGSHSLEVQGRIFTGPWSPTAKQSFTVLRPSGLAEPFLMGYAMTMILLASGGYWLEQRRRFDRAKLLPDLAQWRMGALLPEVRELTGTLLDSRYELGELLARGGFANVMAGYDQEKKRRCAIKIFRSELSNKARIMRSFEQEVAALQQIDHPNVVLIYASGMTPSGAPYLVMEFVEGESLRDALGNGRLPLPRIGAFLRQLSDALDAIHERGICHRDVKPENIIVRSGGRREGEAVLIDFSIAIVKDADETLHGLSRAAGTFDYMAPEQAVGYAQPSSDIYSLSKVVIEMLTGSRVSSLLPNAALDLPVKVRELLKNLDMRLSEESIELLGKSLEFDPNKRPNKAGIFAMPIARDLEAN